MSSISILMPVFNERETIEAAIEDALSTELPVETRQLIVVDDGSTDGTRELLRERSWPDNVLVLEHDRNRGKGAAVRTALSHATGDFAAILDADLEYEAASLVDVLEPLVDGRANVVFGTRAWTSHSAYSFWYVHRQQGRHAGDERAVQLLDLRCDDLPQGHANGALSLTAVARARLRYRAGDRGALAAGG